MAFLGKLMLAVFLLEYPPGIHAGRDGENAETSGAASAQVSAALHRTKRVIEHLAPDSIANPSLRDKDIPLSTVSHLSETSPTHASSSSLELANHSAEVDEPQSFHGNFQFELSEDLREKIRRFAEKAAKADQATTDEERRKHVPSISEIADVWKDVAKSMSDQYKEQVGERSTKEGGKIPPL
mmetsp:Transcript_59536/g.104134  ORF Transcript_59536/g.104134 Transcript_59536/m.104134 type:complete len:183 (-) Transcript_59536:196-744(-)